MLWFVKALFVVFFSMCNWTYSKSPAKHASKIGVSAKIFLVIEISFASKISQGNSFVDDNSKITSNAVWFFIFKINLSTLRLSRK